MEEEASKLKMAIKLTMLDYCGVENRRKRRHRKKKFLIEDILTTQTIFSPFTQVEKMNELGPFLHPGVKQGTLVNCRFIL